MNIPTLDLIIIIAYLAGITAVGMLSIRRKQVTGEVYFLAGRALPWPIVGAALFASNISAIHMVGLPESGYKIGLVVGNYEWMATFTLLLLALVFAPFYFKSRISTLPEFLERRYSPLCRSLMACMAILSALLIHIGFTLFAGATVFKQFFQVNETTSIIIIALITAVYTVMGGLRAVVVTETIQSVILLVGAVAVTILALLALPGAGIHSLADFKAAVKPDQLSMLHASNADGNGWYAFLLGFPILGIWYWCTDQTIVQRVLGARSQKDAQNGALFAGLLKILPVFLMVLPGVIGYVLFKDAIGEEARQTFPLMVNKLVPTGLKGLVAAAMLAATMSSTAAALNSIGTLVAMDIVKHFRPQTQDRTLVRIGGVCAVVVMLMAMAWSTQAGSYFSSIFEAINKMPAEFLAPPLTTLFMWGVFWRRGTKQGAITTLIFGFTLGLIEFALDLPLFGKTKWISDVLGIQFLMQGWWNFCLCSVVLVVVSLLTPKPDPAVVEKLTWANPLKVIFHGRLTGATDPRLLAAALCAVMLALYWIFR
ncbi:MAG: sodium/solute symporter [Verrucomicrobia bacterium]|nr:sodium/solute symporter [Verrucomicrobiota bacterium]